MLSLFLTNDKYKKLQLISMIIVNQQKSHNNQKLKR